METTVSLLLRQDSITGFSYSFSKALLEKLKKLKEGKRLFLKGKELTPIAFAISEHLSNQISPSDPIIGVSDPVNPSEVDELISLAEEFLKTFEVEQATLDTPIKELRLSVRSRNALRKLSVNTLGEITHITEKSLLNIPQFGEGCLNEVKALLKEHGLSFKKE